MFELADRLIGIYKTFDCTKSVAIDPGSIRNIIKPRMFALDKFSIIGIFKLHCYV